MAIRFVDQPTRVGVLGATLDDVTALLQGVNVHPQSFNAVLNVMLNDVSALFQGTFRAAVVGRTGAIAATLDDTAASFTGTFRQSSSVHGTVAVTLDNVSCLMQGTFTAAGSGTGPAAPTSLVAYNDGTAGTVYVTFAASDSSATSYELLTSNGVTGSQKNFTLSNSSVNALSCRVDACNIPAGSITVQVRARNAGGVAGPYSVASNSVVVPAFVNTWPNDGHGMEVVACGGNIVGLNSRWHDGYYNGQFVRYVAPGTPTSGANATVMNCPAYPPGIGATNQLIAELTPQINGQGFGYLVNIFLQNPALGSNGAFNSNPFGRFCGYIFPTVNAQHVVGRTETTINFEGVPSAVAGAVNTFANQTMATNTFVQFSTAIFNRTNGGSSGWVSNTANTVTSDNAGGLNAHAGDHLLVQVGDQLVGQDAGGIEQWVKAPVAGVLTPNVWNRFEIPVGVTGWNLPAYNFGIHYKQNIAFPTGTGGKGAGYIYDMGWVQGP